jgi:hypothetical protein
MKYLTSLTNLPRTPIERKLHLEFRLVFTLHSTTPFIPLILIFLFPSHPLDYHHQLPPAPQIELILEKPSLGVLRRPMVRIRRKWQASSIIVFHHFKAPLFNFFSSHSIVKCGSFDAKKRRKVLTELNSN